MGDQTSTKTNKHKDHSKDLLQHGVKFGENGGMVTRTMKAADFSQVWFPPFMHLDPIKKKHTIENMYMYVIEHNKTEIMQMELLHNKL